MAIANFDSFGENTTLAINYYSLIEAYGSGAPYYSRTTNMDKWSNPIPYLAILDSVMVAIAYFEAVGEFNI